MKFVRFFAVACALTLLAAATAQAITPKDFFSTKSQNMEMVILVIGQSEMGGVDGQLQRAQESLALAKGESEARKKLKHAKMAWFYAFHAAFLTDTAVPKEEQGKYHQAVGNVLAGAAQVLLISQENFEPLMTGTVTLFGEGEQRLQAQMNADEGPVTAKADEYYEAHAAESTAQKAQEDAAKSAKGGEEGHAFALLQIAKTANAKSEKARGKAFPALTANAQAYKKLDRDLYNSMMQHQGKIKAENPIVQQEGISAAWNSMGYSFDATFRDTFYNIDPETMYRIRTDGTMNLFIITSQLFKNGEILRDALEKGVISRDSAIEYITSTQRFLKAINQNR